MESLKLKEYVYSVIVEFQDLEAVFEFTSNKNISTEREIKEIISNYEFRYVTEGSRLTGEGDTYHLYLLDEDKVEKIVFYGDEEEMIPYLDENGEINKSRVIEDIKIL